MFQIHIVRQRTFYFLIKNVVIMQKITILFLLVFGHLLSFAQISEQDNNIISNQGIIRFDSKTTSKMLNAVDNLRKVDVLLTEKSKSEFERGIILGTSLISIFDYQSSNRNSKFGYLMRHPTSANEIGKTVSEFVIHSAQISVTGDVNNWMSFYTELLYSPEQSFGPGTITSLGRNQIQLRKGFVVFGDLKKFPIYGAIGKMDAPFGQTESVNPFTNSTIWHAFGALGYGAQVSFKKSGFHATVMGVQGGAQFRVLNNPVDSTNVPSRINNFVLDANYTLKIGTKNSIRVGASYVHGTSYCQDFPVQHFNAGKDNNPAVSYYTTLLFSGFEVKAAYASTMHEWPGTFNPNPPLDVFKASKVSSLSIGAKYNFKPKGQFQFAVSGEFSNFVAGPDGSPWERQNQTVLGLQAKVKGGSKLFLELFNTQGYSPLNWISGGNFPDPGTTWSDRDATSYGIVIGAQVGI